MRNDRQATFFYAIHPGRSVLGIFLLLALVFLSSVVQPARALVLSQGTLKVAKVVDNTLGGTAVPSDFQIHVKDASTDVSGSPFAGDASGTLLLLNADIYQVSEDGGPANYTPSFSGCDNSGNITVTASSTVTCTITNTYTPPPPKGSITVCKLITDDKGNIVDGSAATGTEFVIPGLTPSPATSQGAPASQLADTQFIAPLTLNHKILSTSQANDAQCITHGDLGLGGYYYGEETISGGSWQTPLYNDQFTTAVSTLSDFFPYSGQLFDADPSNDPSRNQNADGHIVLNADRPDRTLVVLNTESAPPSVFTLDVSTTGNNGANGTVTSNDTFIDCQTGSETSTHCSRDYASGTIVSLTTAPNEGSSFADTWTTGPCVGTTTSPCVFTVTGNVSANAHFSLQNNTVTTTGSTGGGGGGGGTPGIANPNLNTPAPQPQIAGAQTISAPPPAQSQPQPQIAGATTLPRTGMNPGALLLVMLISLIPFASRKKQQI